MAKDMYGCEIYSLEEEMALPEYVKMTRQNKIRMLGECSMGMRMLEQLGNRVMSIPEKDDAEHAKIVSELALIVHDMLSAINRAAFYGNSKD